MAVQITNQFWFQTPITDISSNQSVCSGHIEFSFSAPITNLSNIGLFGRSSGNSTFEANTFSPSILKVFCVGAGAFQIQSTFSIVPNKTYYLDWMWKNGSQAIYVSGLLLVSGTFAINSFTASNPIVVGVTVDQPGLQVTVSNPAFWDGYDTRNNVGTIGGNADYVNLMIGDATPLETFVPATVFWPFNGSGTPTLGDHGLTNQGTFGHGTGNKYDLTLISGSGSAVYVGNPVYSSPISVDPYINKEGWIVLPATQVADSGQSYITALPAPPTVIVDSTPQELYGPLWRDTGKDMGLAFYLPLTTPINADSEVTLSLPFAGVTTVDGFCDPLVNVPVTNYFGQLEPTLWGKSSFVPDPQMPLGFNIGYQPQVNYYTNIFLKNGRLRFPANFAQTYDENFQPLTIKPGQVAVALYFRTNTGNGIDNTSMLLPVGVHSLVYEDVNALNSSALQCWLFGSSPPASGLDTEGSGPGHAPGSTFLRIVAPNKTTVSVFYWVSYVGLPSNYNLNLQWAFLSPTGRWGALDPVTNTPTISNMWAFGPEDSLTTAYSNYDGPNPNPNGNDRSDPLAFSASFIRRTRTPNGNGPLCYRLMEPIGYGNNYQTFADVPQMSSWTLGGTEPLGINQIDYIRNYNTNSNDPTYPFSSTLIYNPYLGLDGNTPGIGNYPEAGNYIDLSLRGGAGLLDNGAFLSPISPGVVELVTHDEHHLRSGDTVFYPVSTNNLTPYPSWIVMSGGTETNLGSCSVTYGSNSITFSSPQTIAANITLKFDNTGIAYRITTSGASQTNYTIFPVFLGATNASATAITTCAAGFLNGSTKVTVTGPKTLAVPVFLLNGNSSQSRVNVNTEIPISSSSALAGTASVTRLQAAVTTAVPQVNQIGMTWQFSDGTQNTYLVTGGSGVNWTISPGYNGLSTSNLTITSSKSFQITPQQVMGCIPYGVGANLVNNHPNKSAVWVPLGEFGSKAYVEAVMAEILANVPDGTTIYLERGLEHWNWPGFPTGTYDRMFGQLLQYVAAGARITDNFVAPGTPGQNSTTLIPDFAYTVMAAQLYKWATDYVATTGRNVNVVGIYGSGYQIESVTENMVGFARSGAGVSPIIKMGGLGIAPYLQAPNDATYFNACSAALGNISITNILSYYRSYLKYAGIPNNEFPNQIGQIERLYGTPDSPSIPGQVNGRPGLYLYECAVQSVIPVGVSQPYAASQHDCFYNPIFADVIDTLYEQFQDGHVSLANRYSWGTIWGGGSSQQLWSETLQQQQDSGNGSTNVFSTPQGGPAGPSGYGVCYDSINVLVGLPRSLAWIDGSIQPPFSNAVYFGTNYWGANQYGPNYWGTRGAPPTPSGYYFSQEFFGSNYFGAYYNISPPIPPPSYGLLQETEFPEFFTGIYSLIQSSGIFGPNSLDYVVWQDDEIKWPTNPAPFCLIQPNEFPSEPEGIGGGRFTKTYSHRFLIHIVVQNITDISYQDTQLVTSTNTQIGPYMLVDNVIDLIEQALVTDASQSNRLIVVELPYAEKVAAPVRYNDSNEYSDIIITYYVKIDQKLPSMLP
jgi:hypothetical protein